MKKIEWSDYFFTKEEVNQIKTKVRSFSNRYLDGVNGLIRMRNNDKGFALVTVIIIIAIMAVIVTTLANVSVFSYERKITDYGVKDTFYDVEGVLDAIQVHLQDDIAPNLQYIADSTTYLNAVKASIDTGIAASGSLEEYLLTMVDDSEYIKDNIDISYEYFGIDPTDNDVLLIRGLEVGYEDADGYYSKVKTDIKIEAPEVILKEPAGSYSTIAGSGMEMDFGNTNNGVYTNSAYANFTGSIYIGYKLDEANIADYINSPEEFCANYEKWEAVTLTDRAMVTYSGSSVQINGNLYIGSDATVRFEGDTVDIYGGIILEPGAVLTIDENTKLTCYGIYTVDANGNNCTPYTGNYESALRTIADSTSTEDQLAYTGHIPYTYPFVYDYNLWYITEKGSVEAAYPGLDTTNYALPNDLSKVPKLGNGQSVRCYANNIGVPSAQPMKDQTYKLCTMQYNLTEATVLIGTKGFDTDGDPVTYKYNTDFTYTAGSAGQYSTASSFTYPATDNSRGMVVTPDTNNASNKIYTATGSNDYSGIAYPVEISADGSSVTKYIYGSTDKYTVKTEDASSNIVYDTASHKPMTKVDIDDVEYNGSTYSFYYDNNCDSNYCHYIDKVIYDTVEVDITAVDYDSWNSTALNQKIGDKTIQCYVGNQGSGVSISNADGYYLIISNSHVYIQPATAYLNALSFSTDSLKLGLQGVPTMIQSVVTSDEIANIHAYKTNTGTAEQQAAGQKWLQAYEDWGKMTFTTTSNNWKSVGFFVSKIRNIWTMVKSNNGGFNYDSLMECYGLDLAAGETKEDHFITLNDLFDDGIASLYTSAEDEYNNYEVVGSKKFQVISLENWERE